LAAAYVVTAELSLRRAFVHPRPTPVRPPTGIALASLLLFRRPLPRHSGAGRRRCRCARRCRDRCGESRGGPGRGVDARPSGGSRRPPAGSTGDPAGWSRGGARLGPRGQPHVCGRRSDQQRGPAHVHRARRGRPRPASSGRRRRAGRSTTRGPACRARRARRFLWRAWAADHARGRRRPGDRDDVGGHNGDPAHVVR